MGSYLKVATLAAGLAFLTACGTGAAVTGKPCTTIGGRQGVGLDIPAPYAAKVSQADMKICWNGTCQKPKIDLTETGAAVPQKCTGDAPDDACDASFKPDGGKQGFADVNGLPTTPVQVTVRLRDAQGKKLFDQKVEVTPQLTYPNGKHCDKGDPQANLIVANGKLTVRR